jgi:phosphoribosyl-ATP pyrophosphohydrolase/phosphoribosyl-AMP cyclohydrolase/histidinol dehydrogenase
MLRIIAADQIDQKGRTAFDGRTLDEARAIIEEVRAGGEAAVRRRAEGFGEIRPGQPIVLGPEDLDAARRKVGTEVEHLLQRVADRIRGFARAQRDALRDVRVDVPGGQAGHTVAALDRAGCYAPGGRFPLPSTVLMTAVTARVAGVRDVVVASPRPTDVTLAAAAVAGADALLCIGGAHAVAALAYGVCVPARDIIVGPGNRWVTAAKHIVSAHVGIDMLAGPSELVVLADESADEEAIAADLLAQAEHDTDAMPVLVTTSGVLAQRVNSAIGRRLESLPTRMTAEAALRNGFAAIARDEAEAAQVCDALAPEHLQVMTLDSRATAGRLRHYGALFIGPASAEVLGDYGIGPNHTLPTGGTARFAAGLSVLTFLRARTWIEADGGSDDYQAVIRDTAALARLEGLEAHARAAEAPGRARSRDA